MIGRKGRDLIASRCRSSTCPISVTARTAPAASARERAKWARPSAGGDRQTAPAGRRRSGRPCPGSRSLARRTGGDPRRRAGTAAHRAQGQSEHRPGKGPLHQHPPDRARVAAAFQPHVHAGPAAADLVELLRRRTIRCVMPIREDKRYRSWTTTPHAAGHRRGDLHDGRVGLDDRRPEADRPHGGVLARHLAESQYDGVETRYIIHDAAAKEVDEETFYHTRESGGTRISSAYKVCADLIAASSPPANGTSIASSSPTATTGARTTRRACACCAKTLLPAVNMFCYGQVESPYGSGEYHAVAAHRLRRRWHEKLVLAEIENKEGDLRHDQECSWAKENRPLGHDRHGQHERPTNDRPRYLGHC